MLEVISLGRPRRRVDHRVFNTRKLQLFDCNCVILHVCVTKDKEEAEEDLHFKSISVCSSTIKRKAGEVEEIMQFSIGTYGGGRGRVSRL